MMQGTIGGYPAWNQPRFQYIVKFSGRLPVHCQAHHLDVQVLSQHILVIPEQGPDIFVDSNIDKIGVASVEHHALSPQ